MFCFTLHITDMTLIIIARHAYAVVFNVEWLSLQLFLKDRLLQLCFIILGNHGQSNKVKNERWKRNSSIGALITQMGAHLLLNRQSPMVIVILILLQSIKMKKKSVQVWNDEHEEEKVVPALKESLRRLNLSYVDLYLIHWPISLNVDGSDSGIDYLDTWKGMIKCKELGLAKSIGVSNFNIEQLERLLANSKEVPVVNQVEGSPNITQKKLLEFCKRKNIIIVAYTPFGSMTETRDKTKAPPAPRIDDPILSEMGKKYNKTTTQIVLRYLIDCGMVPIPKSVTPARISQNIDLFDFTLTSEEVKKIDKFNADHRVAPGLKWKDHKNYPFH